MPKRKYAIMGATGHVGGALVESLLKKGHEVRALGRNAEKLLDLEDKGVQTLVAAFDDARALVAAFRGADGVFVMIPPSYGEDDFSAYQDRVIEAVMEALVSTAVNNVVNLSSFGADFPTGTGPITGLHRMEQSLDRLTGVNALHLRAASFMENQYWSIPAIKSLGINGSTAPGNIPMTLVATKDIGLKAAEFLDSLSFKGRAVFEFTGPKEYTMVEVTAALGKAIGKPDLAYVQFSLADAKKNMLEGGMKPGTVELMMEMYRAHGEGKILPTQDLTAGHRGKTGIEEFAEEFAQAFNPKVAA